MESKTSKKIEEVQVKYSTVIKTKRKANEYMGERTLNLMILNLKIDCSILV